MPWDAVSAVQTSSRILAVDVIRHLLASHDVNEQYLFLSCLEFLDPRLWAGTMAGVPAVLEGWEVEKVMQFLDSPDMLIRKKV
jgi:AP-4 complex subunit epsilon-1